MVCVIDYGAGNLRSVLSALRAVGCDPRVAETPADVNGATALILPGVGAAADTMENLRQRGLSEVVSDWISADRPFLGICMGLQVLFTRSDEGGGQECLGILPGSVNRLPHDLKVPHMGWNQVRYPRPCTLFQGIPEGTNFYFVHSYVAAPYDPSIIAAVTNYGVDFCSAIARGNLFATQFHPEKSGPSGLQVYRNFIAHTRH
ncbi:MAG: imidazole glycerol phosphate synthase subunit HisH [Chloroflexota bacterium]